MKRKNTTLKKSSTYGTLSIKARLSAKEICDILDKARKLDVCEFSYGDLKFSFTQKFDAVPEVGIPIMDTSHQSVPARTNSGEVDRELYLAELLLTNPSEYEQELEKESFINGTEEEDNKGFKQRSR